MLAGLALEEKWHFGEAPNPRMPYPILDNYLTNTYFHLLVIAHAGRTTRRDGPRGRPS